jgi:hypothetical protein
VWFGGYKVYLLYTGRCHLIVVVRLLICSIWRPNITAVFGIHDTTLFVHQFSRSSNDLVPTIFCVRMIRSLRRKRKELGKDRGWRWRT